MTLKLVIEPRPSYLRTHRIFYDHVLPVTVVTLLDNYPSHTAKSSGDKSSLKKDLEKTKKKFDGLVRKQDQLLRGETA